MDMEYGYGMVHFYLLRREALRLSLYSSFQALSFGDTTDDFRTGKSDR